MKYDKLIISPVAILLVATTALGLLSTRAYSQANFYEGKTVTLIAFTAAGGSGDLRVKAMIHFLKKHIPGNPTVVIEYMDGGGVLNGTYGSTSPPRGN